MRLYSHGFPNSLRVAVTASRQANNCLPEVQLDRRDHNEVALHRHGADTSGDAKLRQPLHEFIGERGLYGCAIQLSECRPLEAFLETTARTEQEIAPV